MIHVAPDGHFRVPSVDALDLRDDLAVRRFARLWSVVVGECLFARPPRACRWCNSKKNSCLTTTAQVLEPLEVGLDINTFTKSVDNTRVYDSGRCVRARASVHAKTTTFLLVLNDGHGVCVCVCAACLRLRGTVTASARRTRLSSTRRSSSSLTLAPTKTATRAVTSRST